MIPLKITFVFNNIQWATEQDKIKQICDFYSSVFQITPTVLHTNFTNLPFVTVASVGGIENTVSTTTTVADDWYKKNIVSLSPDADIIVLYLTPADDHPPRTSVGIMQSQPGDTPKHTCIFGINETDHAYIYNQATGLEMDQGNCFVVFTCHEISHALYQINSTPDNTHIYFYSGQSEKVLPELQLGELTRLQKLVAYLKQLLLNMTTQTNPIKVVPTSVPVPTPVPTSSTKFPPKVSAWAVAIGHNEGAEPGTNNPGNLKYSTLTAGYGARKGRAATDGGNLCTFDTPEAGMDALCNFLVLGCKNQLIAFHQARTFDAFTRVYAGNPPQKYIDAIRNEIHCLPSTDISTFLS